MVHFDEALDVAIKVVRAQLGDRVGTMTIVRDAAGQLTVVLDKDALTVDEWDAVAATLHKELGRFSPGFRQVLLRSSDLIDREDILESQDRIRVPAAEDTWLVDRLLTNQDWLRKPLVEKSPLPLATAFSLKGGVGRSTALAVLAWHLSRQGKRVLAIDLDLEAPGLGSLLLDTLPDYGLVDWMVEGLISERDPRLLDDCLGLSPVAKDSPGIVQVMPAFGQRTRDYVTKVGRVFLPDLGSDGAERGFAARLAELVRVFAERDEPPDAVLLDARAGLHDIGAAAVTQLGAEVFVFARDESQSWQAYRLLFEHLSGAKGVEFGMPDADLRWRLKMVAAQIDKTEGALTSWVEASYEVWSALYDDDDRPGQGFVRDDPAAPHYPLPVYFEWGLRGLSLVDSTSRPLWPAVEANFGSFLKGATARLFSQGEPGSLGDPQGAM